MYIFDHVFIDPPPRALKQTLTEAAAATNRGFRARLLAEPPDGFGAFLKVLRSTPEGQHQWTGPDNSRKKRSGGKRSAAAIAWWSDPLGRKHCRVVADRVYCGWPAERDLFHCYGPGRHRPPLWRVYADDLYMRQVNSDWRLWAVCRCGASGPPEKLGWVGPWCAACQQRADSGFPPTRPDVYRPVVFSGHPVAADDVAFALGGRTVLARVDYKSSIWTWDTLTGQARERKLYQGMLKALAVSPNGWAAALGSYGNVRVWSLVDAAEELSISLAMKDPYNGGALLAISPDGTLLASAHGDYVSGVLTLHDRRTGETRWTVSLDGSFAKRGHSLAFSPDGATLALGWGEPPVRKWNVADGQELWPLAGALDHLSAIAWSPDGKTLAGGLDEWDDANLLLWDVASGVTKASFEGPVGALAFSPDGRLLATGGGTSACGCVTPLMGACLGRSAGTKVTSMTCVSRRTAGGL